MTRRHKRLFKHDDTHLAKIPVAKKHLGQHFLTSTSALTEMIRAAQIDKKDIIVEIGPGTGVLTKKILETGASVIAIEKDVELIPLLSTTFAHEIKSQQLKLITGDIRTASAAAQVGKKPYKIVANIPYYITGEIIRDAFEAHHQPTSITLLVQKEVAERIARSKKESILSLSVRIYGDPQYIKTVPRGSFNPPPNVDSAIIHIAAISRERLHGLEEATFFNVIKCAFKARRKMLTSNLRALYDDALIQNTLLSLNINSKVRAEDIAFSTWVPLVKLLGRPNK